MPENFHLAGFMESVDPAGAYNALTALPDQQISISGDFIRVPSLNHIALVSAGVEITVESFARLVSPSLRVRSRFMVEPFNTGSAAAVEPASPQIVQDLRLSPLELVINENLSAEVLSNPAAAQYQWCMVWFCAGPIVRVDLPGKIFTIHATNADTLVAGAWTNGLLTLDEDLPRGRYAVVGMRARAAGLVAARLSFVGGRWRPGCLGTDAQNDIEHRAFRYGELGIWGEFEDIEAPSVDFLSVSADTAQDVYLDLVQLREGPGGTAA